MLTTIGSLSYMYDADAVPQPPLKSISFGLSSQEEREPGRAKVPAGLPSIGRQITGEKKFQIPDPKQATLNVQVPISSLSSVVGTI